ncbi:hypothetical protein BGZ49_010845 [Haplosporangium sp. Z 27]|nr:hypothetical protein BGZ49_010845 [Haplosporangium sp. Z 27]
METSSSGPPEGSSCAFQVQNELNGADPIQQTQQQPVAQATKSIPSPVQVGAAKAAAQDTTSVREELVPSPPVMFTRERYGHVIVVPFPGSLRKDLVLKVIRSTLRYFNGVDLNLPSRIALMYHDRAEMEADCQGHLSVGGFELPLVKACYSAGKRLQIKTDYVSFGSIEERQEALRQTFKPFGEIIHFHWHQLKDKSRTVLTGSLDFVLDLPASTTRDTMIPRVAVVLGSNTLFSWRKSAFCYRCGRDDHTKATCPKPFNYCLKEDLAFSAPIMAKVGTDESADPLAPLAKPHSVPKKATLPPVSPTSVQKGTSGEWTTVGQTKSAKNRLRKEKRDVVFQ